jgi:hypothetical protein
LGAAIPRAKLYETPSGPVKLAEFIEGRPLSDLTKVEKAKVYAQLQKDFAADALFGNWDVIGLGQDNILVDAKGKPWRIDNGGSLRYRAQGAEKGAAWNDYPTELWSLRDSTRNSQTAEAFGDLRHFELVQQIEAIAPKRSALLKALPPDIHPVIERRLEEMERVARIGRTLEADRWKEDYVSQFTKHSLGLRSNGIIDKLPQRFDLGDDNQLYDESGKLFDGLRDADGIVKDLSDYIRDAGGSYEVIEYWADDQAGSSWSKQSKALKWQLASSRDVSPDEYFWQGGQASARKNWESVTKAFGAQTYQESIAAFHAWNYEQLQRIEMPNNDRLGGTFQAVRTESATVMANAGLSPDDSGVTMRRGAAESFSMFSSVSVYGSEVTVQDIPHHRVFGMYTQSRSPSGPYGFFAGDHENEMVALTEGVTLNYLPSSKWKDATPNYKGSQSQPFGGSAPQSLGTLSASLSWLKAADLKTVQKHWKLLDLELEAMNLGISDADVEKHGSLKSKKSWIAAFEELKATL